MVYGFCMFGVPDLGPRIFPKGKHVPVYDMHSPRSIVAAIENQSILPDLGAWTLVVNWCEVEPCRLTRLDSGLREQTLV